MLQKKSAALLTTLSWVAQKSHVRRDILTVKNVNK